MLFDPSTKPTTTTVEDPNGITIQTCSANIDCNNISKRTILLNPGSQYQIEAQDLCFYISLVKEENYEWKASKLKLKTKIKF